MLTEDSSRNAYVIHLSCPRFCKLAKKARPWFTTLALNSTDALAMLTSCLLTFERLSCFQGHGKGDTFQCYVLAAPISLGPGGTNYSMEIYSGADSQMRTFILITRQHSRSAWVSQTVKIADHLPIQQA